jgi:hypothetical protein
MTLIIGAPVSPIHIGGPGTLVPRSLGFDEQDARGVRQFPRLSWSNSR